jgi:uncharacterized Fe-S cluster-containing radical SAM superfamily enzyme
MPLISHISWANRSKLGEISGILGKNSIIPANFGRKCNKKRTFPEKTKHFMWAKLANL